MTDWLTRLFERLARTPRDYEWFDIGRSPWAGRKFPVVFITRELIEASPHLLRMNHWHDDIGEDFDRNLRVYAWWLYAPALRALWWWRGSGARFCIERAMRGRIADKPEGSRWTTWNWRFRAPWRWTLRRTRPT